MDKIKYELENLEHNDPSKYKIHEGDVWTHVINALNESKKDLEIRWAIFLHDIGKKIATKKEDGIWRAKGHEAESTKLAEKILKKYKFDNKTAENILWLIEHHGDFQNWDHLGDYKKKKLVFHPLFDKLVDVKEADRRSTGDAIITAETLNKIKAYKEYRDKFKSDTDKWEQMKKFTIIGGDYLTKSPFKFKGKIVGDILKDVKEQYITGYLKNIDEIKKYIENKYWRKYLLKNLKISGNDIINMGVPAGPEVGRKLADVANKVYKGELPNEKESLINYLDSLEL